MVLAFLLLFRANTVHGQVFDFEKNRVPMAELHGLMRFHTGDDPRWADPDFDDSEWPLIRSDRDWGQQGYSGYSGVAWYRFRVVVPNEPRQWALYVPSLLTSYQVFADGQLIGQMGRLPPHEKAFDATARALYRLPNEDSNPDKPHAIAIRVWHSPILAPYAGGGMRNALRIGDPDVLADWRSKSIKELVWAESSTSYLAFIESLVGFAALGFFALRNKEREYLWFGASSLLIALYGFVGDYAELRPHPTMMLVAVSTWLSCAYWQCLLRFIITICAVKNSRLYWVATGSIVLEALLALPRPMGWIPASAGVAPVLARIFIVDTTIVVLLVQGVRKGDKDAPLLLIAWGLDFLMTFPSGIVLLLAMAGSTSLHSAVDRLDHLVEWPFPIGITDLADLTVVLSILAVLILRFARSRRDEERMTAELEAARTVQQVLIPEEVPAIPGLAIECVYKPAGQVGGDFFQIVPTRDGGALIVIGDVSGKGMPAAMTVSLLVGTVRTLAHYTQSPGEILSAMNQRMLARSKDGFTTCLVVRIEADGSLTAANAGHLAPYEDGREVPITNGLPLGLLSGTEYEETRFTFALGQQLTLMTDGVVEAQSKNRELFGFERAAALARESADRIAESAVSYGQQDDITVVTIKRVVSSAVESLSMSRFAPSEA